MNTMTENDYCPKCNKVWEALQESYVNTSEGFNLIFHGICKNEHKWVVAVEQVKNRGKKK